MTAPRLALERRTKCLGSRSSICVRYRPASRVPGKEGRMKRRDLLLVVRVLREASCTHGVHGADKFDIHKAPNLRLLESSNCN